MEHCELPAAPDEFYRTLVDNAAEGMLTIDSDSRTVDAHGRDVTAVEGHDGARFEITGIDSLER